MSVLPLSTTGQRPLHGLNNRRQYQYPALFISFIFISAIFGLKRLLQFSFFKQKKLILLLILLFNTFFSAYKIGPLAKMPWKKWQPDQRDALKLKFINLVPEDAAVATSFELGTHLTHRKKIFNIYHS